MANGSTEAWLPVPGMEGRYDVSDQGNVRSWVANRRRLPHALVPFVRQKGYLAVRIRANDEAPIRNWLIHRMVLLAFIGEPPANDAVARHLDGDPTNNRVGNLSWGTYQENQLDTVRHGRHLNANKSHCIHGHAFDAENTGHRVRDGRTTRYCKACGRDEKLRQKLRQASAA